MEKSHFLAGEAGNGGFRLQRCEAMEYFIYVKCALRQFLKCLQIVIGFAVHRNKIEE